MGLVRSFIYVLLVFGCASCFDLNPSKTTIHEAYVVRDDVAMPYMTLYLDTNDGFLLERCPEVKRVGYQQGYIFIQAAYGNYWFAVKEDKGENDVGATALLHGPLNFTEYRQAMQQLGVGEVEYQYP